MSDGICIFPRLFEQFLGKSRMVSPLVASPVSSESPTESCPGCFPPWTWISSVFPWLHGWTFPEDFPHLQQSVGHLFVDGHPETEGRTQCETGSMVMVGSCSEETSKYKNERFKCKP